MKIAFDHNNILTLIDPDIPQHKTYTYVLDNYQIESTDTLLFVYQKRAWKLINLKNLGDGMQIAFSPKNPISTESLDFQKDQFLNILSLFQGFNEETWIKYHFLPFWNWDIIVLKGLLTTLNYPEINIEKTKWWTIISWLKKTFLFPEIAEDHLSFLFALALIYGKFEGKDWNLKSIKIHLPLIWIQAQLEEKLINMCKNLQKIWLFIKRNTDHHAEKKIFQFQINDFELLTLFASWNSLFKDLPQRNTELISNQNTTIKNQLISFIEETAIPAISNKEQILPILKNQTLKFLKY